MITSNVQTSTYSSLKLSIIQSNGWTRTHSATLVRCSISRLKQTYYKCVRQLWQWEMVWVSWRLPILFVAGAVCCNFLFDFHLVRMVKCERLCFGLYWKRHAHIGCKEKVIWFYYCFVFWCDNRFVVLGAWFSTFYWYVCMQNDWIIFIFSFVDFESITRECVFISLALVKAYLNSIVKCWMVPKYVSSHKEIFSYLPNWM